MQNLIVSDFLFAGGLLSDTYIDIFIIIISVSWHDVEYKWGIVGGFNLYNDDPRFPALNKPELFFCYSYGACLITGEAN